MAPNAASFVLFGLMQTSNKCDRGVVKTPLENFGKTKKNFESFRIDFHFRVSAVLDQN